MSGGYVIRRKDVDGRKRTVCYVETVAQWTTFVTAWKAGYVEVDCVRAIDSESER